MLKKYTHMHKTFEKLSETIQNDRTIWPLRETWVWYEHCGLFCSSVCCNRLIARYVSLSWKKPKIQRKGDRNSVSFSYICDEDDCHLQADMVNQLIKQEDIHNEDSTELETVSQCLQLLSFVFHVAYRFISTRFLCVDSLSFYSAPEWWPVSRDMN